MSYLLFTSKYTRDLIEIGYHDADERIDEIEDFLYSSDGGNSKNAAVGGKASASGTLTSARHK
jgi:NTE family protein